jgi:hypothetical protein
MNSQPIAAIFAVDATRRQIHHAPTPEPPARARRPRRALATTLQAAAHRLDPCVAARPSLGR